MNFVRFILLILLFSVAIVSCQKDESADLSLAKSEVKSDTSNNSRNFLAVSGTLNITVGDSTYTFDASKDSVAFINANIDSNKYFGITAINKVHTMSFGISSPGFAGSQLTHSVAGSQLLFNTDGKQGKQYALAENSGSNKLNFITLEKYMQDSLLTKGTFTAIMTNSADGHNASLNTVKGSFNLRIK